jgi:hypothetical protein
MITINEKSWHYRLITFVDLTPRSNLCPYCWQVIVSILLLILGGLIVAGTLFSLGNSIGWIIAGLFHGFIKPEILAVIGTVLISVVTGGFILEGISRWRQARRVKRNKLYEAGLIPIKEPSLFRLWLKAKHDKICPALTFKQPRSAVV